MSMKGVPYARNYKIPKLGYVPKAERIKREREARIRRAKTLSTKEGIAYEVIREFGIAQMQALGRGTSEDEVDYAKKLIKRLEDVDE